MDNLYKIYKVVPNSATQFRALNSSAQIPPADLAAIVGYVPANFNMLPWALNLPASNFIDAQWTLTRSSITAGVVSPTGANNAQHLTESASSGTHFVQSANAPMTNTVTPINMRVAVIAKAAERNRIVVNWNNFQDANAAVSIGFDLVGGKVGYDNSVGSNSTLISTAMQNLGRGWWLCRFDVQYNATATPTSLVWQPQIFLDNGIGTAPRSISYTGDGISGVNLWWFNILPVTAWSLNNIAFQDDFDSLNTIDLNDTGAAGFKWYVHNLAPNSFMTTFGWKTNPPSAPTPPANLSISSPSVLKIYNPNNNQSGFTSQIWSVYMPNGGGFIGTALAPPMVFDGFFNWDGTFAGVSSNWAGNPAFWGSTTDALTGTPSTGRFLEWDVVEGAPVNANNTGASTTKHEWSNPSSPVDARTGSAPILNSMVLGTFRRISGMWLKIDASGWGIFLSFIDGQFLGDSDIAYSASSLPQPTFANAVVGTYSEADSQLMPVFMDTAENVTSNPGGGWAMYIDWIKIYTT